MLILYNYLNSKTIFGSILIPIIFCKPITEIVGADERSVIFFNCLQTKPSGADESGQPSVNTIIN